MQAHSCDKQYSLVIGLGIYHQLGFPDISVGKESACIAGDPSSIPRSERSTGEGKGYPLQYSGLENSMDYIFNSDDHYIYYSGQESLRRIGVAIIINKRVQNAVLEYNLKNDRMISVHFQGKLFNITVIQVYAPTRNAEEAEVEQFY